jgi:polyribonucleotide 5'-hydroxyl-kinase
MISSSQVVELDHPYRERLLVNQLHAYMYGHNIQPPPGVEDAFLGSEPAADLILSPSSTVINFGDLTIYRIGARESLNASHFVRRWHRTSDHEIECPLD